MRNRSMTILLVALLTSAVLLMPAAASTAPEAPADNGKELVFMVSESPLISYNEQSAVSQELMKRTGVKFQHLVIPSADYNAKKSAMLASNDLPDLVKVNFSDVQTYAGDGLFVNLSEYQESLPAYFGMIQAGYDSLKFFKVDGDYYHFARTAKANPGYLAGPMIREDMLAAVGMQAPEDFEELYLVLKAFKQQDPACIPWSTRSANFISTMAYTFGSGNGVYFEEAVDGGKFIYAPLYAPFGDLLAYLNRLYVEGLIDPDYTVTNSAQWQENLSSGKSYFFYDNTTFTTNFNKVLKEEDPVQRFVPMATLKNGYAQQRSMFYAGIGVNNPTNDGYSISADAVNLGGALMLMDYMYSEEGSTLISWGIEGEHYTVENGRKRTAQPYIDAFKTAGDPWRAFQGHIGTGTLTICPYFDNHSMLDFLPEEEVEMYEFWSSDPYCRTFQYLPVLSAAENERYVQINSTVNTIMDTEINKFIMGLRPLSEFGKFQADLIAAGAGEIEQLYAEAYSRIE